MPNTFCVFADVCRRFYWSINFGALISHTLVSYICQYGLPFLGGKDWGFFVGFTIPCVAMTLSIIVFVAGTPRWDGTYVTGASVVSGRW